MSEIPKQPPSPHSVDPSHAMMWSLAAAVIAALVVLAMTPFGGWVESFIAGSGTRWQNAYTALEAAETNLPRDPRERERLLIALAGTEGDPPAGMKIGPRIHGPGTLARLRYETFDDLGNPIDDWQVRALVPTIGNGEGPVWREACPPACGEELARTGGLRLMRSGEPGIASEWALRMPVGKTFDLEPRPLITHDILDQKPRRLGIRSVRDGERTVQRPAKIRVTLVEACTADVRVGAVMGLEMLSSNYKIPIPTGFRTTRWVQVNGCGKLAPFPPPPPEAPPVYVTRVIPEPPDLAAIVVRRETGSGHAKLRVDEGWLQKHNVPVVFHLARICRYDATAGQWQRLPPPDMRRVWRLAPLSPQDASNGNRVAFELPQEVALFWLQSGEQNDGERSAHSLRYRDALVTSGPILCNDVDLGPPPSRQVAACVPYADRAEARFVLTPAEACAR
jgi:hypothetical protein